MFKLDLFDMIHKMLIIFKVIGELANQGLDDMCQFLGHPIGDGPPTGDSGPEGDASLVYFRIVCRTRGTALVGYSLLYLKSLSPPYHLMSLRVCASLFFGLVVGVLMNGLISVGVC